MTTNIELPQAFKFLWDKKADDGGFAFESPAVSGSFGGSGSRSNGPRDPDHLAVRTSSMAEAAVARIPGPSKIRRRSIASLVGQRRGRLVVQAFDGLGECYALHRWRCLCDCGTEKTLTYAALRKSQSCGCLLREITVARSTSHGLCRKEAGSYRSWKDMRARCNNPNDSDYSDYGGRGISVCDAWADFARFFDDMGSRPSAHSLDRIDVNGNYEPTNCRWATDTEQANNKRNNLRLEMAGVTKTLAQWCAEFGISRTKVRYRIKIGWPLELALRTDIDGRSRVS